MFTLLIFTLFLAILSDRSNEVLEEDIAAVEEMDAERLVSQQEALKNILKE